MRFLSVVLIFLIHEVQSSEVTTLSTHDMNGLLKIEKELLNELNNYIAAEKKRLKLLERFSENTNRAVELATQTSSTFLYDPVNIIQTINRYTNGWMKLHKQIYVDNDLDLMRNISEKRVKFPTNEDFDNASTAFLRLQDIYRFDSKRMAKGSLGMQKGLSLNSEDCYAIGKFACDTEMWKHCRQWMLTTLEMLNEELISILDNAVIYEYLALSEYNLGNLKTALYYTNQVLKHNHDHERAEITKKKFEQLAIEKPEKLIDREKDEHEPQKQSRYEELCREPKPMPSHFHKKLICYYNNNNKNPRLLLKPIKTEIAYSKPEIYVFHDFIFEKEINRLRELANSRFKSVTVENMATGLIGRSNKSTTSNWFNDPLGYVDRIDQRIEDLTGLDMSTADQLQVVNYGIGSEYDLYNDLMKAKNEENGKRLSSLLIYLTDVDIGGATVFPFIGVRIAPMKGSAVFWWNLMKSGEQDYTTLRAECPVLVGSKWVCNKWVNERGQEFRRPCGLSPEE